jgi:hypothetical protein
MLDINAASALYKASPRTFGAFIESKPGIRYLNAMNSDLLLHPNALDSPAGPISSLVCRISRGSSLNYTGLVSWLTRRYRIAISSSIVVNNKLLKGLSSVIGLKDRGFATESSSLTNSTVMLKEGDESSYPVSWLLLYSLVVWVRSCGVSISL